MESVPLSRETLEALLRVVECEHDAGRSFEARKAAEGKVKRAFVLPDTASKSAWVHTLKWLAQNVEIRRHPITAALLNELGESIEAGPEGGEGVFVTREQVQKALRGCNEVGGRHLHSGPLGFPREWLQPETKEGKS